MSSCVDESIETCIGKSYLYIIILLAKSTCCNVIIFEEWAEEKSRQDTQKEWKKDKAEERLYKEKIKEQIERDRLRMFNLNNNKLMIIGCLISCNKQNSI